MHRALCPGGEAGSHGCRLAAGSLLRMPWDTQVAGGGREPQCWGGGRRRPRGERPWIRDAAGASVRTQVQCNVEPGYTQEYL